VPIHVVRADEPPEPQENTHTYFYRREYYPRNSSICELAPLGGAPMDVEGTEDNAPPPPPPAAAAPDAAPAAARKPSGRTDGVCRQGAIEIDRYPSDGAFGCSVCTYAHGCMRSMYTCVWGCDASCGTPGGKPARRVRQRG
jgi:hypothetical protein